MSAQKTVLLSVFVSKFLSNLGAINAETKNVPKSSEVTVELSDLNVSSMSPPSLFNGHLSMGLWAGKNATPQERPECGGMLILWICVPLNSQQLWFPTGGPHNDRKISIQPWMMKSARDREAP